MNELLTTYLPTLLILCIVYITNFFKPFFFEAVVTVNLTALLVLTTLFISVSGEVLYSSTLAPIIIVSSTIVPPERKYTDRVYLAPPPPVKELTLEKQFGSEEKFNYTIILEGF